MATWLDQQIEQLEILVEKHFAVCKVTYNGAQEADLNVKSPSTRYALLKASSASSSER